MITIIITSDVPLTDPRLEPIHRAAAEIAESAGQMVRVVSDIGCGYYDLYEPSRTEK